MVIERGTRREPSNPGDVIKDLLNRDINECRTQERDNKHKALDHELTAQEYTRQGDTNKANQEKQSATNRTNLANIYNLAAQTLETYITMCDNNNGGDLNNE